MSFLEKEYIEILEKFKKGIIPKMVKTSKDNEVLIISQHGDGILIAFGNSKTGNIVKKCLVDPNDYSIITEE